MEDFLQLSFAQISQIHFLRPQWLLLLIVLLAVWLLRNQFSQTTQWRSVLPAHLAPVLLSDTSAQSVVKKGRILLVIWVIGTLALAGPTWQKIEKPVFQVKRASVILMDMSLSMRSTDIKPNRLTRARFKAMDLADAIGEGEVALVAYAGDAFTISPLTADPKNLTALIPSLTPEIMPELGSYPLLGLEQSAKLLEQAGYLKGDIFWFTDGIDDFDLEQLRNFAADTPYRINIMAFGTVSGAPIKLADGSLMKDGTGSIVIPKLTTQPLITIANMTSGLFVTTTANDRDVKTLAALTMEHKTEKQTNDDEPKLTGDDWHEFGPYLVLLILPFLAVKFRRGATLMAVVLVGYINQPQVVYANNEETNSSLHTAPQTNPQLVGAEAPQQAPEPPPKTPWYHKVFKRGDQVAQAHYDAENYAQAAVDFDDPKWKGAAAYKAKDFETALNYFSQDDSPTGWYNRGNALANLGQLDEAIAAYDKVLAKRPQHDGALKNKALLEQLKQQEQQQQNQQDGEQQDQQQDGGQEQNSDQQQSSEGDNQSQSGEEQQNQQQNGEQNEAAEPSPQENSETGEEQQSQQSQQNDQQAEDEQQAAQAAEQQDQQQDGQESDETAQSQYTPLTPEQLAEQEQQQKIEQLLRKVSDDPATLLRNKMILENRKRQPNNRAPKGAKKSW